MSKLIPIGIHKPQGNTVGLEERVSDLEHPDSVLKHGEILIDDLNVNVPADTFNWRINQVEFLNIPEYNTILSPTNEEYIRYDLLVGNLDGTYEIKQGIEGETSADIPTADSGTITLAVISLKGDKVLQIIPEPIVDLSNLENRVSILENFTPTPTTAFTGQPYMAWSGTGFKHDYNLPSYYIEGILYPASTGDVTPTVPVDVNPRYVSFFVEAGGVNYRLGESQENPILPTIDSTTEIFITSFLVLPGATEPNGAAQNVIHNEQAPGEWTFYSSHANITAGNTTDPLDGTECINAAATVNNTYFELTAPEPQNIVDADGFKFWIKNVNIININKGFSIAFYNGSTKISKTITFKRQSSGSSTSNPYGIVYTNTSNYQLIVIPYQDLEFEHNIYTKVRFNFISSITVKFDYLALIQSGGGFGVSPDKKGIKTIITNEGIKTVETSEAAIEIIGEAPIQVKVENEKIVVKTNYATATEKSTIHDEDKVGIADFEDSNKTKFWKWSTIKTTLANLYKSWFLSINTQAGITYTFAVDDYKKRTIFTSTNPVTATVPTNAVTPFAIGTKIEFTQKGDGVVTLAGAGITFTTNLSLSMVKGETRILTKIATDEWTVEGSVKSSLITGYNYYVDGINGNDATAVMGDILRPYKTLDAALSVVNFTSGKAVIEILTDGVYYIDNSYTFSGTPILEIKSEKKVDLSWVNNTNSTVLNTVSLVISMINGRMLFSTTIYQNISIGSANFVVINCLFLDTGFSSTNAAAGLFSTAGWMAINIKSANITRMLAYGTTTNAVSRITINKITAPTAKVPFIYNTSATHRYFIYVLGGVSGAGSIIFVGACGEVHLGDISTTNDTQLITTANITCKVVFYNSVISGSYLDITNWNMCKLTLSGTISSSSTALLKASAMATAGNSLTLEDFTCDLKSSNLNLYSLANLILKNCKLKCDTVPFTRYSTSTNNVEVYGDNSIYSATPSVLFGASNSAITQINNYGIIRSNIPALGTGVTNTVLNNYTY